MNNGVKYYDCVYQFGIRSSFLHGFQKGFPEQYDDGRVYTFSLPGSGLQEMYVGNW